MKLLPSLKKSIRIATPVLIALLLTIAILPGAALAQGPSGTPGSPGGLPGGSPGGTPGGAQETPSGDPPEGGTQETPAGDPPEGGTQETPAGDPPEGGTSETPAGDPTTEDPPVTPPTGNTPAQPHASAPFTPPADCIVAHAATPAQICPIGGGLQYYFIGPGSSQPGPWIQPFSELATLHAGVASLYSGTNPFTGKSVQIHYLPADQKIRVSTFYPDNQYDTNKPYNFTVDANNSVNHEAW